MKWVKGVEDLNICIIGAQGIVGVGDKNRSRRAKYRDSYPCLSAKKMQGRP